MDPALYKAATQGDVASLPQLLPADGSNSILDSLTPQRNTALHLAALHGHTSFAREVLTVREDMLLAKNADGDIPLHLAAREGKLGVAELLAKGLARRAGQGDLTVETPDRSPLMATNCAGDTPLHEAVRHRRSTVALMLLEVDASSGHALNERQETPLHVAAREGLVDVVEKIVSSGQTWLEVGSGSVSGTALHRATLGGHIRIMEILLEKRPQLIDLTDNNGNTALHSAARKNHTRAVSMLLKKPTDLALAYKRNNELRSPLYVAAYHGSTEAMSVLLRHCPDLAEMEDSNGRNAFHASIAGGKTNALRFLLRHARSKELLNRVDKDGNTPLHLAAKMSRIHSAMLLLRDRRVDPCVLNRGGHTARSLIEDRGIDELDTFELYLWTVLKRHEAARCPDQSSSVSIHGQRASSRANFERRIETYLLVAALVATVTFAATFTMPGGYSQTEGTAIHSHRAAFKIFVVSNTVAMSSSSVVLLCFLWAWQDPIKFKLRQIIWGHRLTFLACLAMLVSLMAAVYVTVAPTVRWPVYTVIVIGASTPVFVYLILGKEVLYVPL